MSYPEFRYEFEEERTVMIYGRNKDDEGADSNGSGKSAILKAITVALVDVPDASLNKEDYIRDGEAEASLSFGAFNPVTNHRLDIERVISRSGSNRLVVYENGEINNQITSVKEGNQRILELIGITKEDILNYFIINQENSHSFFEATDAEQKKIVSRFTNSSLLDRAIIKLTGELMQVEQDYKKLEENSIRYDERRGELEEALVYEEDGRSEDYKTKKKELVVQINRELQGIERLLKQKKESLRRMEMIQFEINRLSGVVSQANVEKDLERKKDLELKVKKRRSEVKEATVLSDDLDTQLSGTIQCPKCGHEWSKQDPDANLEELRGAKNELDSLVAQGEARIQSLENSLSKLADSIEKKKESKDELKRLMRERDEIREEYERTERRIAQTEKDVKDLRKKVKQFKEFFVDTERIKALKRALADLEKEEDKNTKLLAVKAEERESLVFWQIHFGIKGFKTFLVNKVLSSLEGYVNFHLKKFRTNLQVKINGYRTTKSGDVSEKIDILVSRDGETWRKYRRHSGGQRQRINVCGILTIHKLINMASKSGGLNMLLLDEFFEGLDALGQTEILNILDQTDITNMVISHNNSDIGAERQLWVEYSAGVSRLMPSLEKAIKRG